MAEAARWGDFGRGGPKTKADWERSVNEIRDDLRTRSEVVEEQLRRVRRFTRGIAFTTLVDAPLFPAVPPPVLFAARMNPLTPPVMFRAAAGRIHYTLDGTDPRRPDGSISPRAHLATGVRRVSTTLLGSAHPIRALVPESGALGGNWRDPRFDDSSWLRGRPPVGYELRTGYERLIGLDLRVRMAGRNASAYTRSIFSVEDLERVQRLTLRLKFEDGFVAYLNGVEVARAGAPATLAWNSAATNNRSDQSAVQFQNIDISEHRAALRKGNNLLAIHALNDGVSSSDFLLAPELVTTQTFGGETIAVPEAITPLRARILQSDRWSPLLVATVKPGVEAAAPGRVVISEIMYHPTAPDAAATAAGFEDAETFEYIELLNTGSTTIDLAHCRFTSGVEFTFADGRQSILPPGTRVVVVRNSEAFRHRYGVGPRVAGSYRAKLSNGGEALVLEDASGRTMQRLIYRDVAPWPEEADGKGSSLVLLRPETTPDVSLPQSWTASSQRDGTPGR